ncbi:hypothetical protein Tco_0324571 [Tanacetum coccineum]
MSTVSSGVSIPVSDPEKAHEALAGPDPEPMKEDQTGSDSGKLHVSLAGPNPKHMDKEFLATAYPKHDSDDDEDDDDDEGPSAGSNQGRSTKRRRSDSAASGSAKPPPKADDQSLKKPRESEASTSKQHPTLSSTGWQITDTREAGVDSSMHRSDPESEHFEQSSDDSTMQDEGNDSDMEDTDNTHIPKVSTTTWFKPIPESERPATPEPEWTILPNDFSEPENN